MVDWKAVQRIEKQYERALKAISKQIQTAIGNINNPKTIIKCLKQITNQKEFQNLAEAVALKMTTQINKKVAGNWRIAARENSKGKQIYETLKNEMYNSNIGFDVALQVIENAKDIKTLPLKIAEEITDYVNEMTVKGVRASDIAEELKERIPKYSKANATLIARTEVSRTQSALVRARAERLGINCYIWHTSKDSRVRNSHKIMDNVIVFWSDPPSPEELKGEKYRYGKYHAGEIFNCRCYSEPIIDINFINFPHKVYKDGVIKSMTKTEFLTIAQRK